MNLKKLFFIFLFVCLIGIISATLYGAYFYNKYSKDLPNLDGITKYEPRLITTVFDKNDEIVAEFSIEKRRPLNFEEIPDVIKQAFIAAEDEAFYDHSGINLTTIFRAAIKNFLAGKTVQGGSTITQQVIKSILLTPEKSYIRKLREVILAKRIEKKLSKKEILTLYLNHIYLGGGFYGVEAASLGYFNKSAKELNIAEASILAGLPKAPKHNPINSPKIAKNRQLYVIRRMREAGFINSEKEAAEKDRKVKVFNRKLESVYSGKYFVEEVRKKVQKKYGDQQFYKGGLKIYTTMDKKLQLAAEKAIISGLNDVDKRAGLRKITKKLKDNEEIALFLSEQHKKLVQEEFNYKILNPNGELTLDELAISSDTPLNKSKIYQAILIKKNSKTKELVVGVGNVKGYISPKDYKWAKDANSAEIYKDKKLRKPFYDLKIGDVIEVTPTLIGKRPKFSLNQSALVQGALFSYEIKTGEILAIVGGYDFEKSEFNRATQALRQSGSAFKPFIYAAALESGLTPSTIIVDSPMVYKTPDEKKGLLNVWRPDNYGSKFYGDTKMREAIVYSRNVPTIKILQHVGIEKTVNKIKKFGIKRDLNADLSLALGTSVLTLRELAQSWSPFANRGKITPTFMIKKIVDRNNEILYSINEDTEFKELKNKTAMSEGNAYLITDMLKSVVEYGTAAKAMRGFKNVSAGKTGTTNDFIDSLYVGYTPKIMTGVWVGFDENTPIGPNEAGGKAAAPIWKKYMQKLPKKMLGDKFTMPKNIVQVTIDYATGGVPTANTTKTVVEKFISGTAPSKIISSSGQYSVSSVNRPKIITGNPYENKIENIETDDSLNTDTFFREEM